MVYKLLPQAVKCGISIKDFWDYSLGEINIIITAYVDNQKSHIEEIQQTMYTISALTASFVSRALGGKEIPSYDDIFNQSPDNQVIAYREKMKAFFKNAEQRLHSEERR